MGTLEKTHVEEFVYSVNNPRGPGQGRNLQSHSFLFGISSFFPSPDADNFNEVESCSSLLVFNCQLASQQCFGAALSKKNKKTPLILSFLPLALIKAVTVPSCANAAHFLLCLGFFFFRGSSNAFQVLGSVRFGLVLQLGFFTICCFIIYKNCKGRLCTVNGLFAKYISLNYSAWPVLGC